MTCSLVVNSKSGNTRMVSGAIKRALQAAGVDFVHAAALSDDADADQVALEAQGACAADTVLVGFWCDKGACTPSVAALLSALHGKRVFLFGTCGFGADQSYYQQIIDRVTSNLAGDAELAGWAMCQGKMGPAVKQRYEAMLEQDPDDVRFKMLLDNWVAAKDHPTKEDLDKISQVTLKDYDISGKNSKVEDSISIVQNLAEQLPDGVVFTDKEATVALVVDIQQITETSFELPLSKISLKGSNTAYTYQKSGPGSSDKAVTLKVKGISSEINSLTTDNLTALIDVSNYGEGEYDLPLTVIFDDNLELAADAYVHVVISKTSDE